VKVYRLSSPPDLSPRYNIAPSQPVAVVRQLNGGERELSFLQWGLVPSWLKDSAGSYKMINARSETAHEKPAFKQALRARRCILPASGFYEWEKVGRERVPHYIHLRDGDVMSMAGLWERWKSSAGEVLESCTILTTVANSLLKGLHDRMPVLLHGEAFDLWLDREIDDASRLAELFLPYPSDRLQEYIVSKGVNTLGNDDPGFILPAEPVREAHAFCCDSSANN